ncbi:MAG: hypothetical protein ABIU54_13725, partial [Candidatus Eisenbacteria bacterium]
MSSSRSASLVTAGGLPEAVARARLPFDALGSLAGAFATGLGAFAARLFIAIRALPPGVAIHADQHFLTQDSTARTTGAEAGFKLAIRVILS